MKKLLDQVKEMGSILRKAFPDIYSVSINARHGETEIMLHNFTTNAEATEVMRSFGIGDREKSVFNSEGRPWHTLEGKTENGVRVQAFVNGLPPTCRIEKYVEKIPKTETVDTGSFIEVERQKIVCDS